jgi:hypothetical protein
VAETHCLVPLYFGNCEAFGVGCLYVFMRCESGLAGFIRVSKRKKEMMESESERGRGRRGSEDGDEDKLCAGDTRKCCEIMSRLRINDRH